MDKHQLELIGKLSVKNELELYKVVDFLNKTLKDRNLIFGVSIKDQNTMEISVYNS